MNKVAFAILVFFFAISAETQSIAQIPQKKTGAHQQIFFLEGKITIDSLTKYVHSHSGVRFSFNSVNVKGSKEISFPKGGYSIQDILQRIRKTTSLSYTFYSGYVVFQDNPPKKNQKVLVTKKNAGEIASHPKKTVSKSLLKKSAVENQSKERKETIKQKQDNITATVDKSLTSDSAESKDNNQNPNRATAGISSGDSTKKIASGNNPTAIQQKRNSGLNDNTKTVSVDSTKDRNNNNQKPFAFPANNKRTRIKNRLPLHLNYGLQWNLDIPVYGFNKYFTGTNGKNQFYNLFIPGVWISKTIGKNNNELLLLLKPEQQYLTGNKTVATATGPGQPPDSSIVQKNTSMIKTNSVYFGLQYNFFINDKWSIGGGINIHWQTAALARQQTIRLFNGTLLSDSLYGIKKSSPGWQYLESTFFTGRLEVSYSLKKLQLGGAVLVPLRGVLSSPFTNFHPVNGHVFLRWRIQ